MIRFLLSVSTPNQAKITKNTFAVRWIGFVSLQVGRMHHKKKLWKAQQESVGKGFPANAYTLEEGARGFILAGCYQVLYLNSLVSVNV